jgi:hypothetical protein
MLSWLDSMLPSKFEVIRFIGSNLDSRAPLVQLNGSRSLVQARLRCVIGIRNSPRQLINVSMHASVNFTAYTQTTGSK